MSLTSEFVFATCQLGAESALKQEVERRHPRLRFAFSRPGFITFKSASGPLAPSFELEAVFARELGLSFGELAGEGADERARALLARLRELAPGSLWTLHVFERDRFRPGEEPQGFRPGRAAAEVEALIRSADGEGVLLPKGPPRPGALVADLVLVEPEVWWLGAHTHGPAHAPFSGGVFTEELPGEAPSRAYLKLEEAVHRYGVPLQRGDVALEVGSAPGGAALALLRRGVSVVGIDAAVMAPVVMRYTQAPPGEPRFKHLARPAGEVSRRDLPPRVDWLLLDINAEPDIALNVAEPLASDLRATLSGVLFTLKLSDWRLARRMPDYRRRVESMGMRQIVAKQLFSNRRDVLLYGLTHRGVARLARGR